MRYRISQNPSNDNTKLISLQVMGDKLIHASATPEKKISDDKSLIVIPKKEFGTKKEKWAVKPEKFKVYVTVASDYIRGNLEFEYKY